MSMGGMRAGSATLSVRIGVRSADAPNSPRETRSANRAVLRCIARMSPAGNILAANGVDQHESRDALRPKRGEAQRDGGANVDADDRRARNAQRGERALEIVGLGGEPESRRRTGDPTRRSRGGRPRTPCAASARAPGATFRHRKLQVPKPWISTTGAPP